MKSVHLQPEGEAHRERINQLLEANKPQSQRIVATNRSAAQLLRALDERQWAPAAELLNESPALLTHGTPPALETSSGPAPRCSATPPIRRSKTRLDEAAAIWASAMGDLVADVAAGRFLQGSGQRGGGAEPCRRGRTCG